MFINLVELRLWLILTMMVMLVSIEVVALKPMVTVMVMVLLMNTVTSVITIRITVRLLELRFWFICDGDVFSYRVCAVDTNNDVDGDGDSVSGLFETVTVMFIRLVAMVLTLTVMMFLSFMFVKIVASPIHDFHRSHLWVPSPPEGFLPPSPPRTPPSRDPHGPGKVLVFILAL